MVFSAMRAGKSYKSRRAEGGAGPQIAGKSALLVASGAVLTVMVVALIAFSSIGG